MNTENLPCHSKSGINEIIKSLLELEAKGCHSVFFEYGNNTFHIRIFRGDISADKIAFEKTVILPLEQTEVKKLLDFLENMRNHVKSTKFLCHKREFVIGVKSGEWEKIKPCFEFGANATSAMVIDGSGYFIDDPDNGLQYFVNMNELS